MDPVTELTALLEIADPAVAVLEFTRRSGDRAARRTVALAFNSLLVIYAFAATPLVPPPYTTAAREPEQLRLTAADLQLYLDLTELSRHMGLLRRYGDEEDMDRLQRRRFTELGRSVTRTRQELFRRIATAIQVAETAHLRRRHAIAAYAAAGGR